MLNKLWASDQTIYIRQGNNKKATTSRMFTRASCATSR